MEGPNWEKVREWFELAEALGEPLASAERRKMLETLQRSGFQSREQLKQLFRWSDQEMDRTLRQLRFGFPLRDEELQLKARRPRSSTS